MNRYVFAAFVLAAVFATVEARAEFYSGNDLHRLCTSTNSVDKGVCAGFIIGVFDTKVRLLLGSGL